METLIADDDAKNKKEQQPLIEGEGCVGPAIDEDHHDIMNVDRWVRQEDADIKQQSDDQTSTRHGDTIKLESTGDVKLETTDNSMELNDFPQAEKVQSSGQSLAHSLENSATDICARSSCINSNEYCGNHLVQDFSRENATGSLLLNNGLNVLGADTEITSGLRNETVADIISVSEICISSTPDFSILKGEICLDDLSIRELQEAFRASFGRDTTVKDKLWLKRRIAMGLVNSYDIPTTRFVIKNNKIIYKDINEEATCRLSGLNHEVDSSVRDGISDLPSACSETLFTSKTTQLSHKQLTESTLPVEDCQMVDQFGVKRMRKPTKRYIEELSDLETQECSAKVSGEDKSSNKQETRFLGGQRNFSIRYDSFGGFGILIPYVCRVRTGRPRKNIMALMKYHPSGKSNNIIETNSAVLQKEMDNESCLPVCLLPPSTSNMLHIEMDSQKFLFNNEPYTENRVPDTGGGNGDDDFSSQSSMKTGEKRKHHRSWTLSEVLKLLEGVAMYGAGRWSEIKRLSFTSYPYRTSVDLKDKWRNLLRASFTQGPAGKGAANLRKHTSISIPPAILSRVRELAELNGQVGIQLRPSKVASRGGKSSRGSGSGFL